MVSWSVRRRLLSFALFTLWIVPGLVDAQTSNRVSSAETQSAAARASADSVAAESDPETDADRGVVVAVADTTVLLADSLAAIDAHPQDSPEDRGLLIVSGDGKSTLRLRGSIRLNGAVDFNGLQNTETFDTFRIPTGSTNKTEPRFFMSANQARIGLEASRDTDRGALFMRIEADFLGEPNNLRLRHAFGRLRNMTVGQTWSTFGDVKSVPRTVDLDGPNSSVQVRTVQVRFTRQQSARFTWAVAAEAPEPEVSLDDSLVLEPAFQNYPDVAAQMRTSFSWGHVGLAGVLRSIAVRDPVQGDVDHLVGRGLLLSGRVATGRRHEFLWQVVAGEGVSRFITALSGQNLDVIFNPNETRWETLTTGGGFISYGHIWTQRFVSYLTVGSAAIQNRDFQRPSAFSHSGYFSLNTFWDVTQGTRSGLEYSWGARVDRDGQDGTANRFSFIFYYDF